MLADGETYDGIEETVGCGRGYISRWRGRFLEEGAAGVYARHRGRLTPRMKARILARTQGKPKDGSTHWSTRNLARELGVSHMLVQGVWSRAGI